MRVSAQSLLSLTPTFMWVLRLAERLQLFLTVSRPRVTGSSSRPRAVATAKRSHCTNGWPSSKMFGFGKKLTKQSAIPNSFALCSAYSAPPDYQRLPKITKRYQTLPKITCVRFALVVSNVPKCPCFKKFVMETFERGGMVK